MGQLRKSHNGKQRIGSEQGNARSLREKERFDIVLDFGIVQQLWICCDVDSSDGHNQHR
jgi:hypothetical protein